MCPPDLKRSVSSLIESRRSNGMLATLSANGSREWIKMTLTLSLKSCNSESTNNESKAVKV
jgi:hypothetical protein